MSYILQSPSHGDILFLPEIPKQIAEVSQPGVSSWSAVKEFGDIFLQTFSGKDCGLKWHYYYPKEEISVIEELEGPYVYVCVMMGGLQLRQTIDNIGEIKLNEWQYYLLYVPESTTVVSQFKKGGGGRHFTMRLSIQLFRELLDKTAFPDAMREQLECGKNCLLPGSPGLIPPDVLDIVSSLFNNTFFFNQTFENEVQTEYYYRLKVGLVIWHLLIAQKEKKENTVNQKDVDAVIKAKQVILENLAAPLSERELARRVRLNIFKLKKLFKEVLGQTLYEFTISNRLDHGRQQLINTDKPVKEIAAECGYQSTDTFAAAFKKKFSMSPDALRKSFM